MYYKLLINFYLFFDEPFKNAKIHNLKLGKFKEI